MLIVSLTILLVAVALLGVTLWNVLAWPKVAASGEDVPAGALSILIPARDEERNVGDCLDAALAQGEVVAEVLVYDDHSADRTALIVRAYGRRDARVRLVAPAPLPAGWCGKNFACARLAAESARPWLLFLDADTRLAPGAAARVVAEAQARGATLLSCWIGLRTRGFWEGALMPLLNFVVFTLYPAPLAFRRRLDPALGLAHGACLLARRDAYARVGGHEAVRGEIFEDVCLARLWRARGETSLCLDGRGVAEARMYDSFGGIWRGFQKNFHPAFRRGASFWLFLSLHFAVFLAPFALAILLPAGSAARACAVASAVCVLAARAALALRFRHPWWSVALHPVGELILLALGLSSWWRCRGGRGVVWKGRRYRAGAEA